ncbi:MAG: hypothetical protein ACJAQU_002004 [Loktanella salsilacus]|jgi:hypothetical protein
MARLGAVRVIDAWGAQIRKLSYFCLAVVNAGKYHRIYPPVCVINSFSQLFSLTYLTVSVRKGVSS